MLVELDGFFFGKLGLGQVVGVGLRDPDSLHWEEIGDSPIINRDPLF